MMSFFLKFSFLFTRASNKHGKETHIEWETDVAD